jgi:hypothetical protein
VTFLLCAAGEGTGAAIGRNGAAAGGLVHRPAAAIPAASRASCKTRHAESGGNDHARNPKSSAEGRFQFTDGTFRTYYHRLYGVDPGAHPSADLKLNPDVQERLMRSLTADNAAALAHSAKASPTAISTCCISWDPAMACAS